MRCRSKGQYDGYLSAAGFWLLKFLGDPENIRKLKAAIDNGMVNFIDDDEVEERQREMVIEAEERRNIFGRGAFNSHCESLSRYPGLNHGQGAWILGHITDASMPVVTRYLIDWIIVKSVEVYIIDLDTSRFEILKHILIEKEPCVPPPERAFDCRKLEAALAEKPNAKKPVQVGGFSLADLPTEAAFVQTCQNSYDKARGFCWHELYRHYANEDSEDDTDEDAESDHEGDSGNDDDDDSEDDTEEDSQDGITNTGIEVAAQDAAQYSGGYYCIR